MPKYLENMDICGHDGAYEDWLIDTARNYGNAPYPCPSPQMDLTVTCGIESIGGTSYAKVHEYHASGKVTKKLVPFRDVVSGTDDEHTGYHNVRTSDL